MKEKIDAINNASIKEKKGESITVYYVTGTRFALERVEQVLSESNIDWNYIKGTRTISFLKQED